MIAAKLANLENGKRPSEISEGMTQPKAASLLNVSTDLVGFAKKVQQDATPELAEKVSSGDVAVSQTKAVSFDAHGFCFLLSKPSFLCGLPLPR
jgi:hypothetical protein